MATKRQIALVFLAAFIGVLVVVLTVVPARLDRAMNSVQGAAGRQPVSGAAQALHRTLVIVDLHADPLLWKRDLLARIDHGHVDLPRLEEGNVALQVLASVTKTPAGQNYDHNSGESDRITLLAIASLQPVATWFSLVERSLYHARKLQRSAAMEPDRLTVIESAGDVSALLESRRKSGAPVGALLAVEGLHNLEGDLANLDVLYQAGYRMVGLAHFFDNEVAGSMHGVKKYGLTELGRQVVVRAEQLGMLIDLAHSSPASIEEVLDMATRPVVVSHGGVKATCDVNRNLSDRQIRRIASGGGLIGIGYWDAAVCDTSPAGIVDAIDHVRTLVGADHVALGSDFDGAVTTQFDTTDLVLLTQEMLRRDYGEAEIRAIMGGNAIRLFREFLPGAGQKPKAAR